MFPWVYLQVTCKDLDREAKKAAEGLSSNKKDLPQLLQKPLKYNKAALRQQRKEELKRRWTKEWENSTRVGKYKAMDFNKPSNKFVKLISNDRLSRMDTSRIFQLRAGHILLNTYLECFRRADSARCPACRHPKENMQHFLFDCPAYKHEHWALRNHCKVKEPKLKDILNNADMIIPLTNYIQATGRFEQETHQGRTTGGEDDQ